MSERLSPSLISVVMPVRNAAAHIEDQLDALERQTYPGAWELVAVDNLSRDESIALVERRRGRFPAVVIADARTRRGLRRLGLNHARNRGADAARGDFLAFCDADDVVDPGWLQALADAAPHGDLVHGRLVFDVLNDAVVRRWRPSSPVEGMEPKHGFLPSIPGGNCGIWTEVARSVRWDESFGLGSSDTEFAWRAQLAGYRIVFAPDAVIHQRYRHNIAATLRQQFAYACSVPHLFRNFRSHGMPRAELSEAVDRWSWLLRRSPDLFGSRAYRGRWLRRATVASGRLLGSVRWRAVYL